MQTTTHSDPELGAMVTEHGAAWGPRVALFVVITLLAGIFAVAGFAGGEMLLGVISVGVGLALLALIQVLLSKVRLRLFVHGIEHRGPFATRRIAWSSLESYTLQIIDSSAAVAGGVGGVLGLLIARAIIKAVKKNGDLTPNAVILQPKEGKRVVLSGSIAGYKQLVKTLVPSLAERIFPHARQVYDGGREVSFGKKLTLQRDVGLTFTGLFGKKHVLPLQQACSARLEGAALVIRRSDTNAPWQTLQAAAVQNLGVLQRFVETGGKPYDEGMPMAWTS
jgi:hypothetical protein